MSSNGQDNQGIHYHYHFYGPGAAQQAAPGAQPGNPGGFAQPEAPFGAAPGPGGPFGDPFAAGAGAANAHQHPTADSFVKGLLVGAGAAYLLTNETVQRTVLRTAVQLWAVAQGGFEELKERLQDAAAEAAVQAAGGWPSDFDEAAGDGGDKPAASGDDTPPAAPDGADDVAPLQTNRYPRTAG